MKSKKTSNIVTPHFCLHGAQVNLCLTKTIEEMSKEGQEYPCSPTYIFSSANQALRLFHVASLEHNRLNIICLWWSFFLLYVHHIAFI